MPHENDLSDITYAMCQASSFFQRAFLRYCFGTEFIRPVELVREYQREGCRPDFYFEYEGQEHLIEVKKRDQNLHDEYQKAFPNTRRAFIADYEAPIPKEWGRAVTWHGFVEELETPNPESESGFQEFINGYLTYVRSILGFVKVKSMNIKEVSSLSDFYDVLENVWKKCPVFPGKLSEYRSLKSNMRRECFGRYIRYDNPDGETVYFLFALWFNEDAVMIWFEDCDYVPKREEDKLNNFLPHEYVDKPNGYYFPLKEKYYQKLCDTNVPVEEQEAVLQGFLTEILEQLK